MINLAFNPEQTAITYIEASSTSATTFLKGSGGNRNAMELKNRGTGEVFLNFGNTTSITAAAENGYMLSAGERVLITRPTDSVNGWNYVAAVCASGQTAKLVITLGTGN